MNTNNIIEKLSKEASEKVEELKWLKIIIVGSSKVGKTCLIKSYCEDKFSKAYHETIGADYGFKLCSVDKDTNIAVTFWDLSGKDEYTTVRTNLYENTDICIFVYDVTVKSSFEQLDLFIKEFKLNAGQYGQLVVVGNKVDVGEFKVTEGMAYDWATRYKAWFYMMTATDSTRVSTMFEEIITMATKQKSYSKNVFSTKNKSIDNLRSRSGIK